MTDQRVTVDHEREQVERLYLRIVDAIKLAEAVGLADVAAELNVQRARVRVRYLSVLQARWVATHAR